MDPIGSMAACSSELAHGFMAVAAFTATLTIAMILGAATMGRFQSVGNSHSITSMPTRRETVKVMLEMAAMMGATNTALDLRVEGAAGVTASPDFSQSK